MHGVAILRLGLAVVLGAIIGIEREERGKPAGLRTHVLITVASTAFALVALGLDGADHDSSSRVIQGVIAGVGFLGAGAIIRNQQAQEVHGLTTASGIWIATACGLAVGVGQYAIGAFTAVLTLVLNILLAQIERRWLRHK